MKCDNIRTRMQGGTPFFPNMLNNSKVEVCLKEDVDAAIDELKTEHHKERHEYIEIVAQLRRENAELKAKLENVQASMYADVVDANMENRRLRRALWIARAERALAERRRYCAMAAFTHIENDALRIKWCIIQRKCQDKAEEYR